VACCPGERYRDVKQFYCNMVKVKPGAKVITIERAQNVLTIAWVVGLFSAAFGHICALKEVDELVLSSLTQELTTAGEAEGASKAVLFDHYGQFKEQRKEWCRV
jgi:hypothetical protein